MRRHLSITLLAACMSVSATTAVVADGSKVTWMDTNFSNFGAAQAATYADACQNDLFAGAHVDTSMTEKFGASLDVMTHAGMYEPSGMAVAAYDINIKPNVGASLDAMIHAGVYEPGGMAVAAYDINIKPNVGASLDAMIHAGGYEPTLMAAIKCATNL